MGCLYCYYLEKEDLFKDISLIRMPELLLEEYIVQHIEASKEEVIHFVWHGGEPLMAGLDYFKKIVNIQEQSCPPGRRIINGIQTNGTLLDHAWCSFLADKEFLVGISMDGSEKFHNHFRVNRNGDPTFYATLQGYHMLQQFGIISEILCVVNAFNVLHPLEIYDYFIDLGAKYITFLPLVERIRDNSQNSDNAQNSQNSDNSRAVTSRSVSPVDFGDFLIAIFDRWKSRDIRKVKVQVFEEAVRTAFGQDHTLCIFKKTCGGVPVVEHNGDFYSCDHFVDEAHRLGNLLEADLASLLESPEQRRFGEMKYSTLPRYCLECEVLDMCGGECPRNRFIHTPDGEKGLNYLCEGYKRFFLHCTPFVSEVARLWNAGRKKDS